MTIFKTKHTLRISVIKTRPERSPQQMAQDICSIPCECDRRYNGETGRPLAVRFRKQSFLEKSKLSKLAYEEGHTVGWDEARVLYI
jgi:hypothetical protein